MPSARPSTPVLDLGRAIKRVQNKHHRALDIALAGAGLSLAQFDALRAVDRHPGASSHRLATIVFMTDQSFGAIANRLVGKGLISRDAERGRALSHRLTDAGRSALDAGLVIATRTLEACFAGLQAADRGRLFGLLSRLLPPDEGRP